MVIQKNVPTAKSDQNKPIEQKQNESQGAELIKLCTESGISFFLDDFNDSYASNPVGDHIELIQLKSKEFKYLLNRKYYDAYGKLLSSDAAIQVTTLFMAKAAHESNTRTLYRRVGLFNGNFYYDLVDSKWRAIEISKTGFRVLNKQPLLFQRTKNMNQQVIPSQSGSLSLFKKHFRFKQEHDRLLFIVYLVSCFIPDIPHPLLVFAGEKGAAKSTTMRMVRKIVDPARSDLMSLPSSDENLILSLANNYMSSFDNLDRITPDKSDLLCMASTGGAISKRTLYSDAEDTIISFKRCVTLNGINVVVSRPDLLDRSIILQLRRVPTDKRKTENEIWKDFDTDLPQLLGWCFITLSKAMGIYPNLVLKELPRMADFAKWGYAIAEAAGYSGQDFIDAYNKNQLQLNEEVLANDPVAAAILAFMNNKASWKGDWTTLLSTLDVLAKQKKININQKSWPRAAHSLSRKMNEIKSNLEQAGISFEIRRNSTKELTFYNQNVSAK